MSEVFSMLPILSGWEYNSLDITSAVQYTSNKEILNLSKEKGWLIWTTISVTDRYAKIRIPFDGYYVIETSVDDLKLLGFTLPNPSGFWISLYDDVLSHYNLCYMPYNPLGFTRSINIKLIPIVGVPVYLLSYHHLIVQVTEEEKFRKGLAILKEVKPKE